MVHSTIKSIGTELSAFVVVVVNHLKLTLKLIPGKLKGHLVKCISLGVLWKSGYQMGTCQARKI